MFSWLAKALFTLTAFAPVLLTYMIVAFMSKSYILALSLGFVVYALLLLFGYFISSSRNSFEEMNFRADSIENVDSEYTGFVLLYIFPLLTSDIDAINWQFLVPFVGLFAAITLFGNGFSFNPLLALTGWNSYKVTSSGRVTYILFARRKIMNLDDEFKVQRLFGYTLFEIQGEK